MGLYLRVSASLLETEVDMAPHAGESSQRILHFLRQLYGTPVDLTEYGNGYRILLDLPDHPTIEVTGATREMTAKNALSYCLLFEGRTLKLRDGFFARLFRNKELLACEFRMSQVRALLAELRA